MLGKTGKANTPSLVPTLGPTGPKSMGTRVLKTLMRYLIYSLPFNIH